MQDSDVDVITRGDREKRARMSLSTSEQVATCLLITFMSVVVCC